MYLTRMRLDTKKRETIKALMAPSQFHSIIESSYSGEREHPLWRIDHLNNNYYLMILSERKPELSSAVRRFGFSGETWEQKDYSNMLDQITFGSKWHFRLTANPTKSLPIKNTDENNLRCRGKVVAHVTPYYQKEWLCHKAEQCGFSLYENEFEVVFSKWYKFKKGENTISILAVTFEGFLTITDVDLFRNTLCRGIGRGKAYGLGMLTVVKNYV